MIRPSPNGVRLPEPALGACSIIEEADIVACIAGYKLEEPELLDLDPGLGNYHCYPEIPWGPEFRGIVRQVIKTGQRSLCLGVGPIHQNEV